MNSGKLTIHAHRCYSFLCYESKTFFIISAIQVVVRLVLDKTKNKHLATNEYKGVEN